MTSSHDTRPSATNQTDAKKSDAVDRLNSFLRGEISAVETYEMAINKLSGTTHTKTLQDNLASHRARVAKLTAEITKNGGEPAEGSGAWGTFAKLFEGGAAVFGEKAAIAALEEGEDHGRDHYKRELEEIDPMGRAFAQSLLTEQLKTHDVLSRLKKSMSSDTTTDRPGKHN